MKILCLFVVFAFLFVNAIDVIPVAPILTTNTTSANEDVDDHYEINSCQPAGTLLEVFVSNLGFRGGDYVNVYGGLNPWPTKDVFQKGWTTDDGSDVPADSFIIEYPGKTVFLTVICDERTKSASYNIVVAPVKKKSKLKNRKTPKPLEGTVKNNSAILKYFRQTFQAIVTGAVGLKENKYYSFPVCKGSLPPVTPYVTFESHIAGELNSFGFDQFVGNRTVTFRNYVCKDNNQATPSYVSCSGGPLERWNYKTIPDEIVVLVIGYGGNGKDIQNSFILSASLDYSSN